MDYNEICYNYLKVNTFLKGLYQLDIPRGSMQVNTHTMKGTCGIVIPISGSAKYRVDGKKYTLRRGRILFAGSDLPLDKEVIGDETWSYYLLHYDVEGIKTNENFICNNSLVVTICEKNVLDILQKIHKLETRITQTTFIEKLKQQNDLKILITSVIDYGMCFEWDSDQEKIYGSLRYIRDHYSENISVTNLSQEFGLDSKRFYYLFKKHLGLSPKKYITTFRMNRSKQLLAKENYSIAEIAHLVGYEDAFNFSRIFKKYTGIAPNHFRDQMGYR